MSGTGGGEATLGRSDQVDCRVTTAFGERRLLRGTLMRAGAPVNAAVVDVLAKDDVAGARFARLAEGRTDASGRFRIRAPGGPSRTLRVAFAPISATPATPRRPA